jgi:hypothetical protein
MRSATMLTLFMSIGLAGCIRGNLADRETRSLCGKDGGVRVSERVQLSAGRFPTIIPDKEIPRWRPLEGVIFGAYRYADTYETMESHGYTIYRHRKSITRIEDGKVLGEMVQYVRQGEPEFPGMVCPQGLSTEKLVNGVFFVPGEATEPYASCPTTESKQRVVFEERASSNLTGSKLRVRTGPSNRDWARGVGCDERTAIDRWYEARETPTSKSVSLTATRLLFFSPNNHRCQAFAGPDTRGVACTPDGVFALGFRGKTFLIQKFSPQGQLVSEAELEGIAPGALVGYREDATAVTVTTAQVDSSNRADCYVSIARKASTGSPPNARVGPPDTLFTVPECWHRN